MRRELSFLLSSLLLASMASARVMHNWTDPQSRETCAGGRPEAIFDCYPEDGANEGACRARGCCWQSRGSVHQTDRQNAEFVNVPYCFFPTDYPTYQLRQMREVREGFIHTISKSTASPRWPKDILTLQVEAIYVSANVLRLRITDPANKRWEPSIPLDLTNLKSKHESQVRNYEVSTTASPYGITVTRTSDKTVLFQTSGVAAPLIYSDQFLQISTALPTKRVYGIGEQRLSFMHNLNQWLQIALYSHDVPPYPNVNLYGVHNFMLGMTEKGTSFGIFLLNSNAQEVILQPAPAATYRTIGGILDFFIFTAENPRDVVSDYWSLVGSPMLPPYWSMGFHLCRYGYKSSAEVRDIVMRNLKANMPHDVQWSDIDYMDKYLDWTVDPVNYATLPALVQELRETYGKRYVFIIDPGISSEYPGQYAPYDDGLKLGVFVNKSDSLTPLVGKVWPGLTVYPDFSNPQTQSWWTRHMKNFYDKVPFAGLWIDMNEPSNFVDGSMEGCTRNELDNPPYQPGIEFRNINHATVCASALQTNGSMYNTHNLYGYFESRVTKASMRLILPPNERVFLVSRSTFAGSGRYTFHWTGDNLADWDNLYYSIVQVMNFNMYGIPMVGADICGFRQNSNEELCTRWMQAGTFYPFMRNHNDIASKVDQDPAAWGPDAQRRIRNTLRLRYSLLPYMYTQMHHATTHQLPVVQPLFFFYPQLIESHDVDTQFFFGPSLLVAPVLASNVIRREVLLPEGYWCHLHQMDRRRYATATYQIQLTMENIPVYIRGGHVISFQGWKDVAPENATTTEDYRKLPFTFIACPDDLGQAQGDMIWDDGITYATLDQKKYNLLNYTVDTKEGRALFHVEYRGMPKEDTSEKLHEFVVLGMITKPRTVSVNGRSWSEFSVVDENLRVRLLDMSLWDSDVLIQWTY